MGIEVAHEIPKGFLVFGNHGARLKGPCVYILHNTKIDVRCHPRLACALANATLWRNLVHGIGPLSRRDDGF